MRAIFNGTVLAQSDDIVTLDGNPYFPREESPGLATKPQGPHSTADWIPLPGDTCPIWIEPYR